MKISAWWMVMLAMGGVMRGQAAPAATAPAPPTGTVTGHVTCSDTQRAARFADVYLLPKATALKGNDWLEQSASDRAKSHLYNVNVHTLLDGSYTFQHVAPGDYYVIAKMPGYAPPFEVPEALPPDPKDAEKPWTPLRFDMAKVLENVPVVHVAADRETRMDLTMPHGGVIAGRMVYDDGTPATDLFISVTPVGRDSQWVNGLGQGFRSMFTDEETMRTHDDGSFRVSGLLPGKYIVQGILWTKFGQRQEGNGLSRYAGDGGIETLDVYAPGVFRLSETKPVELKSDGVIGDVMITVKLDGLHHVDGKVLGGDDRHPVSWAVMTLKDESGFSRSVNGMRGEFHFDYIPEGTYTLRVEQAEDIDLTSTTYVPQRAFKKAEFSVIVGEDDVVVDDIQLAESKPKGTGGEAVKQ